jgi:DNA-directed RNA polymerase specialized sigma24 family protein
MARKDQTDIGGACEKFLTTHWSLIESIQSGAQGSQTLMSRLLQQYWKPVYCYLRRRGYDNERAKDLTQGFFQEVVLGRELIRQADRDKGSFRKFLLTALEHYLNSIHRKDTARKRQPTGKRIPWEQIDPNALDEPTQQLSAEESFNYAWLASLLEQVLTTVEADCQAHGLEAHWGIFRERVLEPIMNEMQPPSLTEIGPRHGITDQEKASNMIITVNRRLQTTLRRHLRQYVSADAMVDEEVGEFLRIFCKKGAG